MTQTVLAAVAAAGVIESPYELMCCMRLAQTDAVLDRLEETLDEWEQSNGIGL